MKGIFCAIALFVITPMMAEAEVIDADRYFAYVEVRSSNPQVIPTVILLSHERCEAKGTSPGGRKALYLVWGRGQAGCWDDYGRDLVAICRATGERGQIGNDCIDISASRFTDTATLPRQASFR